MNDDYREKLFKEVDNIINGINNLNDNQLKSIDLDYLKIRRKGDIMVIVSGFDTTFLANMWEYSKYLNNITFPNIILKNYAVLFIDLVKGQYLTHRLYSFPTNIDKYDITENSRSVSLYIPVMKSIQEGNLEIDFESTGQVSSALFNSFRPINDFDSSPFSFNIKLPKKLNFDIDHYIENYVTLPEDNIINNVFDEIYISDPFYHFGGIGRQDIIDQLSCECKETESEFQYICKGNCEQRKYCNRFHVRKCRGCNLLTYYRRETCLKCYLSYTSSSSVDDLFNQNGKLHPDHLISYRRLRNYIPFVHYNTNSIGLCIGGGSAYITNSLKKEINPIKLILSFKANLSYTDQDETIRYYKSYEDKINKLTINENAQYVFKLNDVMRQNNVLKTVQHTFSLFCYCAQCFYYKILLFIEDKKLDPKTFKIVNSGIISRNKFIAYYKKYLTTHSNKNYIESGIHKIIKRIVNTPPQEFIISE